MGAGGSWTAHLGIPAGACAFGAEGRMASIGPSALGAKGCGRCRGGEGAFGAVGIEVGVVEPRLPLVILSAAKDLGERRY